MAKCGFARIRDGSLRSKVIGYSEPSVLLAETNGLCEEARKEMDALVIHARSLESAEGFRSGLADFQTKLTRFDDGRYQVEVVLDGDREMAAVLGALVKYVTERGEGPARLELDGKRYTLPSQPALNEPAGVDAEHEPEPQSEAAGTDG